MNKHIEVIEDNACGITIQHTATKAVAHYPDRHAAQHDLESILAGDDISGWDLSDPDYYITDEEYHKHSSSGGYKSLDQSDIEALIAPI